MKRSEKFLGPLTGKVKRRKIVTFDIESKDGDTQERGFTRPFLVDFFDGENHYEFRNDPEVAHLPWETRHIQKGGCIDKFMRWLLAMDGCAQCGYGYTLSQAMRGGRACQRCREHRIKYSGKTCDIFSHNGGRFDELFLIGWLLLNRKTLRFEITAVANRIQKLEVMPVGKRGERSSLVWVFLDSAALIPLPLHKIGKDILGNVESISAVAEAKKLAEKMLEEHKEVAEQKVRERKARMRMMALSQGLDPDLEEEKGTKELATAKLEMDLNLPEDHPSWTVYVRADNEVLFLGVKRFIELMSDLGGDIGITAPSSSMRLFRRKFQKRKISRNRHFKGCDATCHKAIPTPEGERIPCASYCDLSCHGCAHAFIREGYYGGRTELFRRRGKKIYYYDINSSYPASMLDDMPVGDMVELKPSLSWDALRVMRRTHVGFLEVEIEIPEGCTIPPIPVRHDGKLVFPTGKFRGVWDFDELELLFHPLVNGRVLKVHRSVWYESEPIFREMVAKLYHYRTKHAVGCFTNDKGLGQVCGKKSCNTDYTEGLAFVAKLMLNSLYGKFGMREDRTGVVMVPEGEEPPSHEGWPINGKHDSPFWEVERYVDAAYIIPQISAHITSLSRIRLWRGMAEVVERGGVLYYVDTDSIMCSVEISTSDGLGGWKREEVGHLLEGEFVLPKLYQLKMHKLTCIDAYCQGCDFAVHKPGCDDKECKGCASSIQKMKGVQHKLQTLENWRAMVYERKTIEGTRLMQHRGMFNKGVLSPTMVPAKKSLQTEYDKRVMLKNGGSKPLHLDLLQGEKG